MINTRPNQTIEGKTNHPLYNAIYTQAGEKFSEFANQFLSKIELDDKATKRLHEITRGKFDARVSQMRT